MFWLRLLLFSLPVGLAFPVMLLFQNVRRLDYPRPDSDLVCLIRAPIGTLNPLVPLTGPTREVTDLLFEPLLIRDDDLNLRPNLITDWSFYTHVTVRCAGKEQAAVAEKLLKNFKPEKGGLVDIKKVTAKESVLLVELKGFKPGLVEAFLKIIPKESLGDFLQLQLKLKDSVKDSFETFLRTSVEKAQIRMLDYSGDQIANIFLKEGDTELFLKEIRLYYESNRNLEPSIEVIGNACHTSSQEMLVQFRNDVRWHDGHLFSTDDVIYSYNEMTRPGSILPLADSFRFVDRVEKIDQRSIRVICRETPAIILESWEKLPVLPAHLLHSTRNQAEWIKFFNKPVGNGPYKLHERRTDGGVTLLANAQYFQNPPQQERIVYRVMKNREARLRAIRFGEIETLVPDQQDLDWGKRNPGHLRSLFCLPKFQNFIVWNLDNPSLKKNEIRTALAQSVDLSLVLQDTPTRFQRPTESLFFPGIPYGKEPIRLPEFDVKSALQLFAKAGYQPIGENGILLDKNKKPLQIKLTVNRENKEQMRLAKGVIEQWKAIGVEVELESLDWGDLLSKNLAVRDFDAVMLGWELPFERDRYSTWHSSMIGPGGGNFSGLRNQVIDEFLEKLRSETDTKKIATLATKLQNEIAQLQPYFFLCDTGRIITLRKDSIEVLRERLDGELKKERVSIGKSGMERVRPWWVRKDETNEGSPVK